MTPLPGPEPEAWNRLALAARNLFATHAWARCWWDVHGDGATPHVLCDDVAAPRVVLPLYSSGRLLRQVRFIGHGPADQLGPVCAPADVPLAAPLLQRALDDGSLPADVVLLQDQPVASPWAEPLGARRVSSEVSPVMRFEQPLTWEAFLASKSKNFRRDAGKKTRRLENAHALEFRLATAETLDADLAELFRLHLRRWDGDTPLLDERQRDVITRFARVALEHGWLRLRTLNLDGRCVAAMLAYRFGDDEYCYQVGRDPDLERESVGHVLMVHAVREAIESGAVEFRFLRGDEDYKAHWTTDSADLETVALARGVRGRAAVAVARRRRRDVQAPDPSAPASAQSSAQASAQASAQS